VVHAALESKKLNTKTVQFSFCVTVEVKLQIRLFNESINWEGCNLSNNNR
jgi:hypothetical protein